MLTVQSWGGFGHEGAQFKEKRGEKSSPVLRTKSVIQCLHMHQHLMIMASLRRTHALHSILLHVNSHKKKITNQLAKNTSPPMKHMHSATHKKMAFSNSLKVQQKQIEILCTQIATHQSGVPEEQRALHTDALLRSPLAAEVLHHRHANPKRRQVSSHYVQLYNPQLV